jgi:lipopolysaccharide/colanic/teichoic acid biosynthesis glycosyltransferase
VKVTSRGPVFYRQERVGRDGQTFSMLKFRSMVIGADRRVEELAADSDGNGVLFKKKDDPRVTGVGRFMRRYSLDELPQLVNVLRGEMSLVGPRPPLPSEVGRYGFDMHRRFLVKPGLTGLWQVSGRSDLSWDDSVRIDVRYVENWSLTFDFMILWKTVGAVLRGSGAY